MVSKNYRSGYQIQQRSNRVESIQTFEEVKQARICRENGLHVIPSGSLNVERTFNKGWFKTETLVLENCRRHINVIRNYCGNGKENKRLGFM
jgi:hypothetical protein